MPLLWRSYGGRGQRRFELPAGISCQGSSPGLTWTIRCGLPPLIVRLIRSPGWAAAKAAASGADGPDRLDHVLW